MSTEPGLTQTADEYSVPTKGCVIQEILYIQGGLIGRKGQRREEEPGAIDRVTV